MVGKFLKLQKSGLKIAICGTCAGARGLKQEDIIEGAKLGSLTNDFMDFLTVSDRLVVLKR